MQATNIETHSTALPRVDVRVGTPAHQAFQILRFGFTVAPIVAGLDKFFGVLVNWDQYLAPVANSMGTE